MITRLFSLSMLCIVAAPAAAQDEEGPDIRGPWFSQVNALGNEVGAGDCPCEVPNGISLYCTIGSGEVRVELDMFDADAEASAVEIDIDGVKSRKDVKLNKLGTPSFAMPDADPLLGALAKGKTLTLSYGAKTDTSPLKGSGKAIAVLKVQCRKR